MVALHPSPIKSPAVQSTRAVPVPALRYEPLDCGTWDWIEGKWTDGRFRPHLPREAVPRGGYVIARSQPQECSKTSLRVIVLELQSPVKNAFVRVQVVRVGTTDSRALPGSPNVIAHRDFETTGNDRSALTFCVPNRGGFLIEIRLMGFWRDGVPHYHCPPGFSIAMPDIRIGSLTGQSAVPLSDPAANDTVLTHWNALERWVHRRCKASRPFNTLVGALEMRMAREELLSLPQYMSLCPTGQCNATCGFCSVTLARTGIIKKQLPLDEIRRFTAPARNTVRQYGLEGNGEPTLYREMEGLVEHVLAGGADAYLITNASQFRPDLIPVLLGLESINISLNAATAETHRRVMALKNFSEIVDGIRELMRQRGPSKQRPQVSVSFVVTRDNVFEAAQYLAMAEFDLRVDRILVRPLSELGNDGGSVEDFRDLVPYQSEIDDLIEAVETYKTETASQRRAEIIFDAGQFRAVRPDLPGSGILPVDRPNEIPAPRRGHWDDDTTGSTQVEWLSSRSLQMVGSLSKETTLLRSRPIAVPPQRPLTLDVRVSGDADAFILRAIDDEGRTLASSSISVSAQGQSRQLRLDLPPLRTNVVRLEIAHGKGTFSCEVDLGRVRRPALPSDPQTPAPAAARWETIGAAKAITWADGRMSVRSSEPPGQYLTKSYSLPCLPGLTLSYPVSVEVRSGTLGIGVLSTDFQTWVKTFEFTQGKHEAILEWLAGDNTRAQFVIYSIGDTPLDADVDWTRAMLPRKFTDAQREAIAELVHTRQAALTITEKTPQPDNEKAARRSAMATAKQQVSSAQTREIAVDNLPAIRRRGGSVWRLLHDSREIYCHKPWTDLHNFTVDGRMDVCCIATGASQPRFALGNLAQQNFQEVWNGPMAREFRRTVNEPSLSLPPCQRCPMARAYAGPLLDPQLTVNMVLARVHAKLHGPWAILRRPIMGVVVLIYAPVHGWFFRGFTRPSFRALIRRYRGKD